MKTRILLVVALLATALGAAPVLAQDQTVVTIYFPIAVDSPVTDILEEYAQAYEGENPGVDIVWSYEGGYPDVQNKLRTVAEGGGELPSAAIMLATDIYDVANAGLVQPWDPYVGEEYLSDFFETWLANSYYDADGDGTPELYGLPFQRSTVLLYYNVTLLEENGLEPPTNWQELAEAAAALTTEDRWGILVPNSWPYWVFQPFALGAGQNIVSESDVEVYFNAPEVVEALQYWVDLYEVHNATPAGVQDNWGDAPGLFANGEAAMIVHSTGSLPSILDRASFEVGVSAVPGRDGGAFTVTGGGNLYLIAGIDEELAQATADFVQWLTAPERSADWALRTGYIPTRISALDSDIWQAHVEETPQAAAAAESIEVAGREFSVQSLAEVRNILHTHILAILNGDETPQEAMDAAQMEAEGVLAIYQ